MGIRFYILILISSNLFNPLRCISEEFVKELERNKTEAIQLVFDQLIEDGKLETNCSYILCDYPHLEGLKIKFPSNYKIERYSHIAYFLHKKDGNIIRVTSFQFKDETNIEVVLEIKSECQSDLCIIRLERSEGKWKIKEKFYNGCPVFR